MTRVTLSIEVQESVDVAALGRWLEGWIRDNWDGHGEPGTLEGIPGTLYLHLKGVEAKPPASGRYCGSKNAHNKHAWKQIGKGTGAPTFHCNGKA